MSRDKIIKLTEIFIERKYGGILRPNVRKRNDEKTLETHIKVNSILSFSRINPKNRKINFFDRIKSISFLTRSEEYINLDLKPYTHVELFGKQVIKVNETPEEIKKLIES
jgi:hypothetical protein